MTPGTIGKLAATAVGALVLLGLGSAPASADPPQPTDYRSTVTEVNPALPAGAEVRVVGGDSLLELTLPSGHRAVVFDYPTSADDPSTVPYLRFDADGTVRRNRLAVATTANDSRYGTSTEVPDPGADPDWETVATDGSYAWHDHRVHWMSPVAPRAVGDDGQVDLGGADGTWSVPVTIDGTPTVVTGTLVLEDPPSLLAWGLLAAMAGGATFAIGTRWGPRAGAGVGAAAASAALLVSWATWTAVPADAGASILPVAIAAIALLGAIVGLLPRTTGPVSLRLVGAAASAAALLGWGIVRWTVLARAVLPTTLAPSLDRGVTAVAIGVGLGLAALLVISPVRQRPAPPITASPTA